MTQPVTFYIVGGLMRFVKVHTNLQQLEVDEKMQEPVSSLQVNK